MNRLDFTDNIPDTTRTVWTSQKAKDKWLPAINSINAVWSQLELETVFRNEREATIQYVQPDRIIHFCKKIMSYGCFITELGKTEDTGFYSSRHQPVRDGKPYTYKVAVHRSNVYFEDSILTAVTRLGYPGCCAKFFDVYWNKEHYFDTTWPQYLNSHDFRPHTNTLLKSIGLRPCFHLPCSFDCEHTEKVSSMIATIASKMGYSKIMANLYALLEMPMEWSALHGYAEIKTPIFKVITKTDATGEEYKFQFPGSFYPEESAHGNKFPYVSSTKPVTLFKSQDFAESTLSPSDNGFITVEAETEAHSKILDTIAVHISPDDGGTLVDLGCGNGLLLSKIQKLFPNLKLSGVEVDVDKSNKAQQLLGFDIPIACKNMFLYDLVENRYILVANQRIMENPKFLEKLHGTAFIYDYLTSEVEVCSLDTLKRTT